MVFKAFESKIFLRPENLEELEESSDDIKYTSFGYDTYELRKKLKDIS